MNEEALRVLVRQVIAGTPGPPAAQADLPWCVAAAPFHSSHRRCALPSGAVTNGPCLIEPSVL